MIAALTADLARERLFVSGIVAEGPGSVLLISPLEPGFWPHLRAQSEAMDGAPDPVDRWSFRVISAIAAGHGARAVFPFGGPPWQPFQRWAIQSGSFFVSPVHLLVHPVMGLWASFRGAIVTDLPIAPHRAANPCATCVDQPCRSACPVQALTETGYDTARCHAFLDSAAGADCLNHGCRVRKACPYSQSYGRLDEQSAHHMRHFHP